MAGDPAPDTPADAHPEAEPDAESGPGTGSGAELPSFDIPARPERRFPYDEGVRYEGSTLFRLEPESGRDEAALSSLVERVLGAGPYRYGDFVDLPMPLYLVRDDDTGDVFRVSVRNGRVRLHVLPETESAGLRAFYRRLTAASGEEWGVTCRVD